MMWNGVQEVWICSFDAIIPRGTNEYACGAQACFLRIKMASHPTDTNGTSDLARVVYDYLQEVENGRAICASHADTAAIHDTGKELQVYRLFKRDEVTARQIRHTTNSLVSWEKAPTWKCNGKSWMKLEKDVIARMKKHAEQYPIITRGIWWEGRPILIHAYKFEISTIMKVELILPSHETPFEELPLQVIASALQCHEYIVPKYIAEARPPYKEHETRFKTIIEYLSDTMPKSLYASQCFPTAITPVFRGGVLSRQ